MGIFTAPEREVPEPLEADDVATVRAGTVVWFALFLLQLPFYGRLADAGHAWWVWTCLAGTGLGLLGLWYVRRRLAAIARDAAGPEQNSPGEEPAVHP